MANHLECEIKSMINEQQYLYLYNKYFHLGKLIKQENIYFNDRNDILKNLKICLRIRTKQDSINLYVKAPIKEGNLEIKQPIDSFTRQQLIQKCILPNGEIKDYLHQINVDEKDLYLSGSLITERLSFLDGKYLICIDKSYYKNIVDYEIEIEGPTLLEAEQYAKSWFKKENIPFKGDNIPKSVRATS